MDKRTILFIIAFGLTTFAVNLFFSHQDVERNKQWKEQHEVKQAQQKKQLESELASRTAKAEQLPLVSLYEDIDGKKFITAAVKSGDAIVTVAWKKDLPKTVYGKSGNELVQQYTLIATDDLKEGPAIYGKSASDRLVVGNLVEFGQFDLQLVSPSGEVSLGEYSDGHFSFPIDKFSKVGHPSSIALLKTLKGFLPVAIYNSAQKELVELQQFDTLVKAITTPEVKAAPVTTGKNEEKFYVLENNFQQLVFSNFGGALIEINLPFQTEKNRDSVVREIEFDREIVQDHPYNAHFPSHPYFTPGANGQMEEHPVGQLGGYYPLQRRDLIEPKGKKSIKIQPMNYALNIVSEYPEIAELVYEVKSFDKNSIVFETVQNHRRITKTFTFEEAPYCLNLTIQIEGESRGLWVTSGIPEAEWISGALAPALKFRVIRNKKVEIENLELPTESTTVTSIYPNWICNSNGFLGMIVQPLSQIDPGYKAYKIPGTIAPSRLVEIDEEYNRFKAADLPGYAMALPLKSTSAPMKFRVFAGPFASSALKTIDVAFTDPETGHNPDYMGCQSFHGWFAFISEPFAKFLFILMNFFHSITNSWGFSIILLTVALRIMLYPLNAWSMKSMARMQQIAPEVSALQERYKKDPKKAQLEIMNLYRERGVNPISGCFPLLIQMPFLIGMFDLLKSTFELRGATFIPGWIDDLTAPDVLFRWDYPFFFIGNEFHLLPFLLGGVMFLQQRLMSSGPSDANLMTEQQRQQRLMGNVMTVIFTIMFYNFPSGLNIYWLSSMLLGILQQWLTNYQMKNKSVKPSEIVVPSKKR